MGNKSSRTNSNMSSRGVLLYLGDPAIKNRCHPQRSSPVLKGNKPKIYIEPNTTILGFIKGINKNEIKT